MKYKPGDKFGRLTLVSFHSKAKTTLLWVCVCECGKQIIARQSNLVSQNTSSCGCRKKELAGSYNKTHGEGVKGSITKEYRAWNDIKTRCYNPKTKCYPNYGGRGIIVCERWIESYENFLADMGRAPSSTHSIERRDVNGNYEPDNCFWATAMEQANNKRNTCYVEMNGKTKSFSDWCRELGLNYNTAMQRVYRLGWTPIEALTKW